MAVDPSAETALDRIVRIAGQFFCAPISVISSAGAERIWAKSDPNICVNEIGRIASAWAQAIPGLHPLLVPDAALDARFASLPMVSTPPGIRFYAGAPLTACGARIGTLAILDTRARAPLSDDQISLLEDFAVLARQEIEHGRAARTEARRNVSPAEIGFWDWGAVNDNRTSSDPYVRLKDWQSLVHPDDREPVYGRSGGGRPGLGRI